MSSQSRIEWTDATWNPVTGCTPISEGCVNCYAQRILHRFKRPKHVVCHERRLGEPGKWTSRHVFVCSMADLFHDDVPDAFIREVYRIMTKVAPHHIYQVLTKRPERLLSLWSSLSEGRAANIWHGVSVENDNVAYRMPMLCMLPSKKRFISFEPLLGPVEIDPIYLDRLKWIIVGGETGSGARPFDGIDGDWVRYLRDRASAFRIPFFFKQWGGKREGAELDGRTWKQIPQSYRE